MDAVGLLLETIARARPRSRQELRKLKVAVAVQTHAGLIRNDALLRRYRDDVAAGVRTADAEMQRILMLNAIRSESG